MATSAPVDAPQMNLLELLRQVAARWPLVLASLVVGLLLGALAAFVPRPTYKVEAILAPAYDDAASAGLASLAGGVGGLASLVGLSPETKARQTEAVLVMQSRTFAEEFIAEHDLLRTLYAEYWDEGRQRWTGTFENEAPTVQKAAEWFLNDLLRVEKDVKNGTVLVSIEWYDPVAASDWVNEYVGQVNEQVRQREISEAEESLKYLEREINDAQMLETRSVLYRLTTAQLQRSTVANVRRDFVFRVIDPARPPQPDEIYRPMRVLLVSLGAVLGLLTGGFLALLLPRRSRAPVQS